MQTLFHNTINKHVYFSAVTERKNCANQQGVHPPVSAAQVSRGDWLLVPLLGPCPLRVPLGVPLSVPVSVPASHLRGPELPRPGLPDPRVPWPPVPGL